MKTLQNLFYALLLTGSSTLLLAGSGPQSWEKPRQPAQAEPTSPASYGCIECAAAKRASATDQTRPMERCKQGISVSCSSCAAVETAILKRQRNDPPSGTQIVWVNPQGERCQFKAYAVAQH